MVVFTLAVGLVRVIAEEAGPGGTHRVHVPGLVEAEARAHLTALDVADVLVVTEGIGASQSP